MPEIVLHYIWQKRLWAGFPQYTTDGKPIEVISVGQYNIHAGPDFQNAHIRIDQQEWVGNIEIHVHASDWYKHHHHTNAAYDNTILHVVSQADKEVYNSRGESIPQCQLHYPTNEDYVSMLFANSTNIPKAAILCQSAFPTNILSIGWKQSLLQERLTCKRQSIQRLLDITQGSWVHAFYISLAHAFGFHTNGLPFELLAIQTPLSCLQKHRNSLFQITAILLGQSGLLEERSSDSSEHQSLWNEYCFLQKKFSLQPLQPSLWKKARMRPQSAPEVRIRQFAHLLYQSEHLFSYLMNAKTIEEMEALFYIKYDDENVYARVARPLPLGKKSIEVLLINTVIPYRYAYYGSTTKDALWDMDNGNSESPIVWLEAIPKEDNTIVRRWAALGQEIQSAADTQALIHLYQNYCQPHQCYHCDVGHQIFAHKQLELF